MDAIKLVEHYAGKELSQEILQVCKHCVARRSGMTDRRTG